MHSHSISTQTYTRTVLYGVVMLHHFNCAIKLTHYTHIYIVSSKNKKTIYYGTYAVTTTNNTTNEQQ